MNAPQMIVSPTTRAARVQHVVSKAGIEAWLVEDYAVPLVAMEFALSGGSSQDADGRMGTAVMMAGLMDEGAGDREALPLAAPLAPDHLCLSIVEGFRGPVIQALETGADGRLVHYKLQDPSLQNWFGLALAVRDNEISDFPICNKSFDLSYCGNDL